MLFASCNRIISESSSARILFICICKVYRSSLLCDPIASKATWSTLSCFLKNGGSYDRQMLQSSLQKRAAVFKRWARSPGHSGERRRCFRRALLHRANQQEKIIVFSSQIARIGAVLTGALVMAVMQAQTPSPSAIWHCCSNHYKRAC
jgi:hypothetical protein